MCLVAFVLNLVSYHRTALYAVWQGGDSDAVGIARNGHIGPGSSALRYVSPGYARSEWRDEGDAQSDSEHWSVIFEMLRTKFEWIECVWARLPDEPTREHRAIAHAATSAAKRKGLFPPLF